MARGYWKLYRFLLGNDVFVSYGRGDGTRYPEALIRRLAREGLVCYYDRLGSPPGEMVSSKVLAQAKRSSLLVVVAGPAAAKSVNVLREIEEFDPQGRSAFAIPIDFEGALQGAIWRDLVGGISEEREPLLALENGVVSDAIIQRIFGIEDFVSRDRRLRRVFAWGAVTVVAVVLTVILFSLDRIKDIEERREAAEYEQKWARMRVELESWQAEEARREREAALSDVEEALSDLEAARQDSALARNETGRQQEIAEALGWANQAEMLRNQGLDSLRGSVARALKTMARLSRLGIADLQTDRTLRKGAGLLRPYKEIPSPFTLGAEAVALSPDGRFIAICAEETSFPPPAASLLVEVWSISGELRKVGSLPNLTRGCQDVGFHQGQLIVVGSEGSVWTCNAWNMPVPDCRKLYDLDDDLIALRSGDGQLLSVSSSTKEIRAWDLAGGSEPSSRLTLQGLPVAVNAELLSLEEGRLAVVSSNSSPDASTETVHVLDAKSGEEQMHFLATGGSPARTVNALDFGARGSLLAASLKAIDREETEIVVWDLNEGMELARFSLQEEVDAIAISPDGLSLATGNWTRARIWDLSSQTEIAQLQGGGLGLTFSTDGRLLAARGPLKRAAFIWDLQRGLLNVPTVALGTVDSVALSQNGRYFAGSAELSTRVWDLVSTRQVDEIKEEFGPLAWRVGADLVFSPSGRYLVGGHPTSQSWLLEIGTGRSQDLPPLLGASFDQEERFIALFGETGIAIRGTGEDRVPIDIPVKHPVLKAEMSPRSHYLAFAGSSPLLEIWSLDMKHGRASRIERLPLKGKLLDLAWSPDEKYLAASFVGGFILIRNTGSWPVVATLKLEIADFGFTARGERLVAVGRGGTLWVHELQATSTAWTASCSSVPQRLAFHPGGRYAATALGNETTEVWDLLLRRRVAHFDNETLLDGLAFSEDGILLVGIHQFEGSARQWLWHPEDLIREAGLRLLPFFSIPPGSRYTRPSPARWEGMLERRGNH